MVMVDIMEMMKFATEKLISAAKVSATEALAVFHNTVPPETRVAAAATISNWLLAARSFGVEVLARLDGIFPIGQWAHVAKPYLIAAVVLAVVVGFYGGGGGKGKTMKAPGRGYRIPRNAFERDPRGYFRGLHHGRR